MKAERPSYRNKLRLTQDQVALIERRTEGFLSYGHHLPIGHVLAEAYLQGMRDALQCVEAA
jgi:hypothetical protein